MRIWYVYGTRGAGSNGLDTLPHFEPFKFRALRIKRSKNLRLCELCLRDRPRCSEGRGRTRLRSWKEYRRNQFRS
jgi:hypothetical protein